AERARQVPARTDPYPLETEPGGEPPQLLGEGSRDGGRLPARFREGSVHEQDLRLPIRLEVDARNQGVPEQERDDVVAMYALVGRRIDLDPVVEVEQPMRTRALPHDGVERRDERAHVDTARHLRRGI